MNIMSSNRNCGIYMIENTVNNKKYIGQTTNIKNRFNNYNNGYFHNNHFKRSVKKYGWDSFKLSVVLYCKEEHLDMYETMLIDKLDLMNPSKGYNKESGGNANKHLSEDTKQQISLAKKGKNIGTDNPFYNKSHSPESIKKQQLFWDNYKETMDFKHLMLNRKNGKNGKPIISEDGTIFFLSAANARKNGYHHAHSVANGYRKHCKNIIFRYATQEEIDNYLKENK